MIEKVHSVRKKSKDPRMEDSMTCSLPKEGKLACGKNEKPSGDQIIQSWRPFKAYGLGHNDCKKPPNPKALLEIPLLPLFSSMTLGIIESLLSLFFHI